MVGHRVGQRSGYYYVVLTVRPDTGLGHRSIATQTNSDNDDSIVEVGDGSAPPGLSRLDGGPAQPVQGPH